MAGYTNRGGGISDLASIVDGVTVVVNGAGKLESVGGAVPDASVTMAKLANLATMSIIGRAAAGTGVPAAITAVTDGHALRLSGTTIGWGTLAAGAFGDNTIAISRLTDQAAKSLLGNAANSSGPNAAIAGATAGHVPRINAANDALAFGTLISESYADDTIAPSRLTSQAARTVLVNATAGSAPVTAVAAPNTPGHCLQVHPSDGTLIWAAQSGGGGGGFTPGATDGRIPFSTTGPVLSDSADFKWDNTNKRVTGTGSTYVQISSAGGSILAYDASNYLSHNGTFARISSQIGGLLVSGTSVLANLGVDNGNDFGTTPTGRGCFGLGTAVAPGTVGSGNCVIYVDPSDHKLYAKGANGAQALTASALWT